MAEQRKDDFQEQELERYGVWVKAGPEEVVEAEEDEYSFADLPSDSAADSEPVDTGMHLDTDLDSLEIPEGDYSAESLDESLDDLGSLDQFEDIEDLGDIDVSGETETVSGDEDLPAIDDLGDLDDLGSLDQFEDIEDLGTSEESAETALDELDVSEEIEPTEEIEPAEEIELTEEIEPAEEIEPVEDLGTAIEDDEDLVTLDDLDIEEPESEQDPFAALEVESEGLETLEEEAGIEPIMPGSDEEIDEISLEDIQMSDSSEIEIPELEEEEHHFTPEEQDIEIVPEGPTNVLSAEEEEILDAEESVPAAASPGHMDEDERQAFEKIQQELDDIKTELAELRDALRSGAAVQVAEPVADITDEEEPTHHGPGFFEEDEDETIALTGDELDNILNTAEFTEETGEAEELEEDFVAAAVADTVADTVADEEISEITLDDSEEAVIDELADMNIEAELADIESLDDTSEDSLAADELELDLDEIEEIGSDSDLLLEEETEPEPADEDTLELSDADLELDETELDVDDEMAFEEFASAVEDDLAGTEVPVDDEELQVEEIDLEAGLEAPTLEPGEDVLEMPSVEEAPAIGDVSTSQNSISDLPSQVKNEIRSVLSYMDQLLEALPDDKIEEFAQSEHFEVYKRLFEELGLET